MLGLKCVIWGGYGYADYYKELVPGMSRVSYLYVSPDAITRNFGINIFTF